MPSKPERSHTVQLVPEASVPDRDRHHPETVVRKLLAMHRRIDDRIAILLKPDTALSAGTCGTVVRSCMDDFQFIHREEARHIFPGLQAQTLQAVGGSQRLSGRMQMATLSRRLMALFEDMLENGGVPARTNLVLARSVLKKALLIRHRHFYQPMLSASTAKARARNADAG
ncbi:MAG: hypothetical protein KDI75_09715 [Xanthomonadales bacterium]|nr:hypothetical protein [Xanthomonadales bacterium]